MNDLLELDKGKEPLQDIPYPIINRYNQGDNIADGPRIRVRCISPQGLFYRYNRVREGEEFTLYPIYSARRDKNGKLVKDANHKPKLMLIPAKNQFSPETMELVEENTDKEDQFSTAQQAVNKAVNELNEAKAPSKKGE